MSTGNGLLGLWKYKDYVVYSVRAKLLTETINNHLGILWLFFEPLLRMFIYYYVFVYLIKRRTEDFTAFLLIGIVAMVWFTKSVMQGAKSIETEGGLIRQLYLPKILFPSISFFVRTIEFFIVLGILMGGFFLFGYGHPTWIAVPFIVAVQFLLTYGIVLIAAGITPFIPDLMILLSSAMTALFFISGVFYEVSPSDSHYSIFMLNPMAKLIEQYRHVILQGIWPDWTSLTIIGGIGVILSVGMVLFIKKVDCYYPRIIK